MPADFADLEIVERGDGIEFAVKVVPGASRTRLAGTWSAALKITVAAPAEGGKANGALAKYLAATLGVHKADVTIVSGHTQPLKRVAVAGLSAAAARERLR